MAIVKREERVFLGVRIPASDMELLNAAASRAQTTRSPIVRRAIRQYLHVANIRLPTDHSDR